MIKKIENKKIVLSCAVLGVTFSILATDLYLPSLPAITQALSTNAHQIKLTLTLYFVGFCLSQLIYGPLSDAIGRKKVLLLGGGIALLGSVFCAIANSIDTLIIARLIQGIGAGAGVTLARAMLRDIYSGKDLSRVASLLGNFTALVPFIAPMVGGYIEYYFDWHVNFMLLALINLSVLAYIYYFLPETIEQKNKHAIHPVGLSKNYFSLLSNKKFMGYALCSFLTYGSMFAYLALSPFLFQKVLHLTPIEFGWLGFAACAGLILGSWINIICLKYLSTHSILLAGISLTLISGVLMLIPHLFNILNVTVILIPFILFTASCKMVFGNALSLALRESANITGTAGALYGCMQILGSVTLTGIAAHIEAQSQLPMSLFFIVSGGLMLAIYTLLLKAPKNALLHT